MRGLDKGNDEPEVADGRVRYNRIKYNTIDSNQRILIKYSEADENILTVSIIQRSKRFSIGIGTVPMPGGSGSLERYCQTGTSESESRDMLRILTTTFRVLR